MLAQALASSVQSDRNGDRGPNPSSVAVGVHYGEVTWTEQTCLEEDPVLCPQEACMLAGLTLHGGCLMHSVPSSERASIWPVTHTKPSACRALSPAYMDRLGREAGMAEASGGFCGLSSARFRSPEHRPPSPQGVRSIMMSSYTMGQDALICASPPAATNSRWGGAPPWASGLWCGAALSRGALRAVRWQPQTPDWSSL